MIEVRRDLYIDEQSGVRLHSYPTFKATLRKIVAGLVEETKQRIVIA